MQPAPLPCPFITFLHPIANCCATSRSAFSRHQISIEYKWHCIISLLYQLWANVQCAKFYGLLRSTPLIPRQECHPCCCLPSMPKTEVGRAEALSIGRFSILIKLCGHNCRANSQVIFPYFLPFHHNFHTVCKSSSCVSAISFVVALPPGQHSYSALQCAQEIHINE